MSDNNLESQFSSFVNQLRSNSAVRILELGTFDDGFLGEVMRQADWAACFELHCVDIESAEFDGALAAIASEKDIDFNVVKHLGSETEVNDALMQVAEEKLFDAAFVSRASSKEALLTACMVCNECLASGGVLALSADIVADASMHSAVSSFREIYGDAYRELEQALFIKK